MELERESKMNPADREGGRIETKIRLAFGSKDGELQMLFEQSLSAKEEGWNGPLIFQAASDNGETFSSTSEDERKDVLDGIFAILVIDQMWKNLAFTTFGEIETIPDPFGSIDYLRAKEIYPGFLEHQIASATVQTSWLENYPLPDLGWLTFEKIRTEGQYAARLFAQEIALQLNHRMLMSMISAVRKRAHTRSDNPESGFTRREWEERSVELLAVAERQIFQASHGAPTHVILGQNVYRRMKDALIPRSEVYGFTDYPGIFEIPYYLRDLPMARVWRAPLLDANWSDVALVLRRGSPMGESPIHWTPHRFKTRRNQPGIIAPPRYLVFQDAIEVLRPDLIEMIQFTQPDAAGTSE